MRDPTPDQDLLPARLKHLVVDTLRLRDIRADQITEDESLIGGKLGLDSLDALSLSISVEEEFGLTFGSQAEVRSAFASVASLAAFIRVHAARQPAVESVAPSVDHPRPVASVRSRPVTGMRSFA